MKQRVTREEVKERLVTDAYFQKGRSALKTRQTILTILAWLMVLVPFVWLAIPLTLPNLADRIAFRRSSHFRISSVIFRHFFFDFSSYVYFINFEEQPPLQTIAAKAIDA